MIDSDEAEWAAKRVVQSQLGAPEITFNVARVDITQVAGIAVYVVEGTAKTARTDRRYIRTVGVFSKKNVYVTDTYEQLFGFTVKIHAETGQSLGRTIDPQGERLVETSEPYEV